MEEDNNDNNFKKFLDLPPIKEFDAFPKTPKNFKRSSNFGGILTVLISFFLLNLLYFEFKDFFSNNQKFSFKVDQLIDHTLKINLDLTISMPCHYLSVDIKDAVGDRMHMIQEFTKEGTEFKIGKAKQIGDDNSASEISASRMLHDSRKGHSFPKTKPLLPDGPACRIYGNTFVKKVTGNLHITTLGHGYLSWEHTDHKLMNLSHVITEFSFGEFFPKIVQPLDNSLEITDKPFHVFQYFISVVPTTYVDRSGRKLRTNQYSVTDMSRSIEHGSGVPGIFFKYDIEAMHLIVNERATSLIQFLVRLAGMVGGIVVCTGWSFRLVDWTVQKLFPGIAKPDASSEYSSLPNVLPQVNSSSKITSGFYTQLNVARSFQS
ncbi:hypothetical protein O181_009294 [Austropuccinia psidii MF-1]|uniref:Endoplasmic reticulum-Golgi intermediate compartment protein 2 n=1 Tax=Austropuccinia psidii MF-1 TaxID=1389203 RepID=A0A9Q3BQK2_9BASI|nr:hypothetical protein [Austropuccinia psidii MF-1]